MVGLFDSFDNLDQISAADLASWLRAAPTLASLENYLANRILYPQTLPQTQYQMQIDLAILREALKLNGPDGSLQSSQKTNPLLGDNPFLNITLRKMLIPVKFLDFVPDLNSLVWVFIDALLLGRKRKDLFEDLWTVVLTDDADETIGSVILPQFKGQKGAMELILMNKRYKILRGTLLALPCLKDRCQVSYKVQDGSVLGKTENTLEVAGGKLGLVIDGRSR